MSIIHREFFGPFQSGTAFIFQDLGDSQFILDWKRAEDLTPAILTNAEFSIFKFAADRVILVEIDSGYKGVLEICATQFPIDFGKTLANQTCCQRGEEPAGEPRVVIVGEDEEPLPGVTCGNATCNPTSRKCPPGQPRPVCIAPGCSLGCGAGEPPD